MYPRSTTSDAKCHDNIEVYADGKRSVVAVLLCCNPYVYCSYVDSAPSVFYLRTAGLVECLSPVRIHTSSTPMVYSCLPQTA